MSSILSTRCGRATLPSPAAAAQAVDLRYDAVEEWWRSVPVQEARYGFVREFCRTSDAWLDEWAAELGSATTGVRT